MSEVRIPANASVASLVGSVTVFALTDVLDLLARTERQGELEVVSSSLDIRLWVDDGQLLDTGDPAPGSDGGGADYPRELFEAACAADGWFYFIDGAPLPDKASRQPIDTVLGKLRPAVTEWHELVAELPFTAYLRLAPTTPAGEVQIKAEEWRLLSKVGNQPGQTIRHLIDTGGDEPLQLLRTLRGMLDAGLVQASAPEIDSTAPVSGIGADAAVAVAVAVTMEPAPSTVPASVAASVADSGAGAVAVAGGGWGPPVAAPTTGWAPPPASIRDLPAAPTGYSAQPDAFMAPPPPPPPPPDLHVAGQVATFFAADSGAAQQASGWSAPETAQAPTVTVEAAQDPDQRSGTSLGPPQVPLTDQ